LRRVKISPARRVLSARITMPTPGIDEPRCRQSYAINLPRSADADPDAPVTGLESIDSVVCVATPAFAQIEQLRRDIARITDVAQSGSPKLDARAQKLSEGGRAGIAAAKREHQLAVLEHGAGIYYGTDSLYARMNDAQRKNYLVNATKSELPPAKQPKPTDCMEWSLQHLRAAYEHAGLPARWAQIEKKVRNAGAKDPKLKMRATVLAQELQKDGWEAVYFNPDVPNTKNLAKTKEQQVHKDSVQVILKNKDPYYGLHVKHHVLNYSPREGSGTELDTRGLEELRRVPFFFGLARAGYHSFVGYDGVVSEVHRALGPDNANLVDDVPLEKFVWDSGIIMVPPTTWPKR
jgi:hypothetical protein